MATRTKPAAKGSSTAHVVMIDTRTPIGVAQLVDSVWITPGKAAARVREINGNEAQFPNQVAWSEPRRVDGGQLVNAHRLTRGTANGNARLNEANVREARERKRAGESTKRLAAEYGVSPQAMSNALVGRTWGHVA